MSRSGETKNMALFCDFENVALGVRESKLHDFDVAKVIERLLLKGSIVVKKAYCDWQRYREFKNAMHQASFELIEIPHVRISGKNSADIRMVVDALDLCYTKSHVDTFVIISGDSDFSPLVSKLRENDKTVIGVGVRNSSSDLLVANCDEFIYYDDLVRVEKPRRAPRKSGAAVPVPVESPPAESSAAAPATDEKPVRKPARRGSRKAATVEPENPAAVLEQQAIDLVVGTIEALAEERGDDEKIWGSMVKQTLRRRQPGFNESAYGFRSFNRLLETARDRGLIELELDEKSGGYTVRGLG